MFRFLQNILDAIFPRHCSGCNKPSTALCVNCLARFPVADPPEQSWITSCYSYRDPVVRSVIRYLKRYRDQELITRCALYMYEQIEPDLVDARIFSSGRQIVLIPIPIHRSRQRERGFNQAQELARVVSTHNSNLTLATDVLVKTKQTRKQALVSNRSERLQNIVGCFAIQNSEKMKDTHVILIDDVTTTGATMTEAKRVLCQAGAVKVTAITLAH